MNCGSKIVGHSGEERICGERPGHRGPHADKTGVWGGADCVPGPAPHRYPRTLEEVASDFTDEEFAAVASRG
jgi:hypothetical protein